MKRILITLLLVVLGVIACSAQEKWRTLTFTSVANVSTQNTDTFMPQLSASLDYEIWEQFAISSWNGFSYNTGSDTSWFASQTTLDKRVPHGKNLFTVGIGYLYTTNGTGILAPVGETGLGNDLFVSFKLQYRIKL